MEPPPLTRRRFGTLLGSAVLAAGQSPAVPAGADLFPFGTHIYREPSLPIDALRADLPVIKRLGFNMVKLQEVWAYDEAREGQIHLDKVLQLVSAARQNGLKVYFGVTLENAPAWLWRKHPDAFMVYEDGSQHRDPTPYVLPADGKPGPCWHHPGARQAAEKFIEEVGREVGKYDNVLVWNVWQEIGFGFHLRPGHLGLCFCPYSLAAFRKWLQGRYETLERLNATWRSAYAAWEEVEPPRDFPMVPSTIDWRYFMDDVYFASALKWQGDAFRRSDPLKRPVLAHVAAITRGGAREWQYARVLDVFGSSFYPAWSVLHAWDADHPSAGQPTAEHAGLYRELWESVMLSCDHLRSASPSGEIWAAELQGGSISSGLQLGRIPSPADIRRWIFGLVSCGARGVCFWNHRPEIAWQEINGFSLLDFEGDSTPRAAEAGRIASALQAHADLFAKGSPTASEAAIVVNEDLFHFIEASGEIRQHYDYSIRGIYKALWEAGIAVEFADAGRIGEDGKSYRLLVLPLPMALSRGLAEKLQRFVSEGGTLVSEACPGRLSEYGMGFAGGMAPELKELFGVAQLRLRNIRPPHDLARWQMEERSFGDSVEFRELAGTADLAGTRLSPAYYLQTFRPLSAKPILLDGDEPAGVRNRYGRGSAWLIGTLLGHAVTAYPNSGNAAFLAAVAATTGVTLDRAGKLLRRRRTGGGKTAWFLFNTGTKTVEESLSVAGYRYVVDLLGGDLQRNGDTVSLALQPLDVRCLVLSS